MSARVATSSKNSRLLPAPSPRSSSVDARPPCCSAASSVAYGRCLRTYVYALETMADKLIGEDAGIRLFVMQ